MKRGLLATLVLAVILGCAGSKPAGSQHWKLDSDPFHLDPGALTVAAPPRPDSREWKVDFEELHLLQKYRTAKECERAATEVRFTLASFFGPPYGPLTTAEIEAPVAQPLRDLASRVRVTADVAAHHFKQQWKRKRPYNTDVSIVPCIKKENGFAYPSGHSTMASAMGDFLAEVFPDRRAQLLTRAEQVARDRVLGGVHHPSDIRAGLQLGHDVFAVLKKDPDFRKAFDRLPKATVTY